MQLQRCQRPVGRAAHLVLPVAQGEAVPTNDSSVQVLVRALQDTDPGVRTLSAGFRAYLASRPKGDRE